MFVKRLFVNTSVSLLFLILSGTTILSQTTESFSQFLIGEWSFTESNPIVVTDASINKNDGQLFGAKWCTGLVDSALSFADSADHVEIPASQSIASIDSQITISCWIKPAVRNCKWTTIIQRSNTINTWMDFQIYAKAIDTWSGMSPAFRIDWNSDGINENEDTVEPDTILAAGKWYFITCTYDGKEMKFYIDGILRKSTVKANGVIPNSGKKLWIGANETWPKEYYLGLIDELRLYNKALPENAIKELMKVSLTDVEKDYSNNITSYNLQQNYPNPFNPTTKIKYTIPVSAKMNPVLVQLKVFDVLGNEVASLVNEEKSSGSYQVDFDGGNLTSGIYFYILKAGEYYSSKKMILLK